MPPEPDAMIPDREEWLFDNPAALASVERGLADAAAGRTESRGSFAEHIDVPDEE